MNNTINCRSKIMVEAPGALSCDHGTKANLIYEDGDMSEDGTWDGESIICDACYLALGTPLKGDKAFVTGSHD